MRLKPQVVSTGFGKFGPTVLCIDNERTVTCGFEAGDPNDHTSVSFFHGDRTRMMIETIPNGPRAQVDWRGDPIHYGHDEAVSLSRRSQLAGREISSFVAASRLASQRRDSPTLTFNRSGSPRAHVPVS